jgi:hypothetical protein
MDEPLYLAFSTLMFVLLVILLLAGTLIFGWAAGGRGRYGDYTQSVLAVSRASGDQAILPRAA